jgi:hypothetical protein
MNLPCEYLNMFRIGWIVSEGIMQRALAADSAIAARSGMVARRIRHRARRRGCRRARRVGCEARPVDALSAEDKAEYEYESKKTEQQRPSAAPILVLDWNFSHDLPHC